MDKINQVIRAGLHNLQSVIYNEVILKSLDKPVLCQVWSGIFVLLQIQVKYVSKWLKQLGQSGHEWHARVDDKIWVAY